MGGTNRLVGAAAANEAGIWGELAGTNVGGGFENDFLGFVKLLGVAAGYLDLGVLEIGKNQAGGIPFENFFGGQGVEAELQILLGVGVFFGLACLVVDNFDVFAAEGIYLVHTADDGDVIFQGKLEGFFQFEHLRRGGDHRGVESAQLLKAVLFVTFLLVVVFKSCRGPLGVENSRDFFERELHAFA